MKRDIADAAMVIIVLAAIGFIAIRALLSSDDEIQTTLEELTRRNEK